METLLSPSYTPPLHMFKRDAEQHGDKPPFRTHLDHSPTPTPNLCATERARYVPALSSLPPPLTYLCMPMGYGSSPLLVLPPSPDDTGTSPLFSPPHPPAHVVMLNSVQGTSPFFIPLLPLTRRRPHHWQRSLTPPSCLATPLPWTAPPVCRSPRRATWPYPRRPPSVTHET